MAYEIAAQRFMRGKAYYDVTLIQPDGIAQSLLIKSWGNPKHGSDSRVWQDGVKKNQITFATICQERVEKEYERASSVTQTIGLSGLVHVAPLKWILDGVRAGDQLHKVEDFFSSCEMAFGHPDGLRDMAELEARIAMLTLALPSSRSPYDMASYDAPVTTPYGKAIVRQRAPIEPEPEKINLVAIPGFGDWA